MRRPARHIGIAALALMLAGGVATAAPDQAAAKAALATARAEVAKAAAAGDQWSPTLAALHAATAALGKADYAGSIAAARRATRLAGLSVEQATAQKTLWHNEVPK